MLPRGVRRAIGCWVLVAFLSACQQSVQGRQLDTNYATTNGVGSMIGTPVKLPHGRYTFFSSADPPTCVTRVALVNQDGTTVVDDASQRGTPGSAVPGSAAPDALSMQTVPTMVQHELASGSYRLNVTTSLAGCAWRVEQILNYILDNEAPLKPFAAPSAPKLDVSLGNASTDLHFHVDPAGIYQVVWSVTPCDRYWGDLVRSDGGTLHLGDGVAEPLAGGTIVGPGTSNAPLFLGAGDWTARVTTRCFWSIQVTPLIGPKGGGTQGFSR